MNLKLVFTIVNIISVMILVLIGLRIKQTKDSYERIIRKLLYSAAVAVFANILIANSTGLFMAKFAYCLYFTQMDWICYFLCMFALKYTDHVKTIKYLKPSAIILCLLDNAFLYSNLVNHSIFDIFTQSDDSGVIYYMTEFTGIYQIHLALDYILVLLGIVALFSRLLSSYDFYRIKYISIIFVVGLIVVLNLIYMTMALPLDFSVLFYAFSGVGLYYFAALFTPRQIKMNSFGKVADYMNEGLVIFDMDRNCIVVNAMARDELGVDIENANMSGGLFEKITAGKDTSSKSFMTIYQTEDNRTYKVFFHNMFDKKNRTLGAFFIFENITEENIALNKMKEAQAEANKANKAKSAFLANMSHEIRTPINSVLGMNEMIIRESTEAQVTEYAQNIDAAGNALLMLINDILDFSKIEAGRLELVDEDYSLQQLLYECYIMLLPRMEAKDLAFSVVLDEKIPARLHGDKNRIMQIMINLISNAAKYTRKGSVKMLANYEKISDEDIKLTVEVADTGIGISEENQKKLFDAFTRIDQEKNRNIEGTGLGLAIAKQLSELMDGTIRVESKVDVGSTFTLEIVQKVVDWNAGGAFGKENRGAAVKSSEAFTAPDARVLVVDDVPLNIKVVQALLKRTEIQVDTAGDGLEAIEKCKETKYDLILMDHMMPAPDGVETFRQIRNGDGPNKETKTIVLTANAIAGVSDEYMQIGFEDYLSKPVKGSDLEAMLLKHLPQEMVNIMD